MRHLVVALLLVVVVAAACAPSPAATTPREAARPPVEVTETAPPAPAGMTPVKEEVMSIRPETLRQGDQWPTRGGKRFLLITGPNAWATFLRRQHGQPDAWPPIDWEHEVVLVALMGGKRTGGYRITIKDVRVRGGQVIVQVEEVSPQPGEMVIQVLTSPFHVVTVPREALPGGTFTLRFVTGKETWEVTVPGMTEDALYEAKEIGGMKVPRPTGEAEE